MKSRILGVTLIELMITIVIIGILAAVVYPSYIDHVTRSNRSEGLRELMRIANLQEQYFVDNRSYTSNISLLGVGASTNYTTTSGHYVISVTSGGTGKTTFTLTATAQTPQSTNDAACKILTITETGSKTPATGCWEN